MTTSIQNQPIDTLVYTLSFVPVQEREKLRLVCKLFKQIVEHPYFENQRSTAIALQKNITDVAAQYPKGLVNAIGGPKTLYDLSTIDLEITKDGSFVKSSIPHLYNPLRGNNSPFLLFQCKLDPLKRRPHYLKSVSIKQISNEWKWIYNKDEVQWILSNADYDYIHRLFQKEICGIRKLDPNSQSVTEDVTQQVALFLRD